MSGPGLWHSKVAETHVCGLAHDICIELTNASSAGELESSPLLERLAHLSETGHEEKLFSELHSFGLTASIKTTYVNLAGNFRHPVLNFRDTVMSLSLAKKFNKLLLADNTPDVYAQFWDRYRKLQPNHPCFEDHAAHLGQVIPIAIHADEGTSLKKRHWWLYKFNQSLPMALRREVWASTTWEILWPTGSYSQW